jgi:hypothetical protein
MNKKLILFGALVLGLAMFPGLGLAATFSITLDKSAILAGDTFSATIKIDSEDTGVNAAQGTISFNKETLQVVSIDKANSVFNFWLQEPAYDNSTGEITFIGGSTAGFIGKALQAVKITFKARGSGQSYLIFTDGAITASDGSGTNLLSGLKGTQFTVGTIAGAPIPVQPTPPPTQTVPTPTQIKRTPTPATAVSVKPGVAVGLYPDQDKWNSASENFLATWPLPIDVTDVATAINRDPNFMPTVSEGLFDNKYFNALDDEIWYLHVRFKNNLGWGAVAHYRIAIDTTPPVSFNIWVDESTSTDTPDPTFHFEGSDQPSGIDHYRIKVGSEDPVQATSAILKLPTQAPGTYKVIIWAYDMAGNITEEKTDLQILPITSPVITSVNKGTYIGEGPVNVIGTTLADTTVVVSIKSKAGYSSGQSEVRPDASGNWSAGIDLPSVHGTYYVEVVARDSKRALSLPVKSADFVVRDKPLFSLGGFEVTSIGLVFALLFLMIGGFVAGFYTQKAAREQRGRRAIIAERDISVVFGLLKKDIDKMLSDYEDGTLTETESKEIEFYLKRMRDNLDKNKRYMTENVEEIKD